MRPGEPERLAEEVHEQEPRLDLRERAAPLTVTVTGWVYRPVSTAVSVIVSSSRGRRLGGLPEPSLREDADDAPLVVGAPALVAPRLRGLGGELRRRLDRVVVQLGAGERRLGGLGPQVPRADPGQRDPAPATMPLSNERWTATPTVA